MKVVINNELTNNKELCYEEGFWTGKKTIIYDGVTLTKVKRNLFEYTNDAGAEQFEVKGNQLVGITIKMFGNEVEIASKLKWYEIVMAIVVFAPCVLFGAIGGAIGGLLGFTNLVVIRKIEKWWLKLIISVQFTAIGLLASYLIAYLLLNAIT